MMLTERSNGDIKNTPILTDGCITNTIEIMVRLLVYEGLTLVSSPNNHIHIGCFPYGYPIYRGQPR